MQGVLALGKAFKRAGHAKTRAVGDCANLEARMDPAKGCDKELKENEEKRWRKCPDVGILRKDETRETTSNKKQRKIDGDCEGKRLLTPSA